MGKVLLAIDGMRPDQQIVDYAAKLCRRIQAELNILHIIDPEAYAGYLRNFQKQVHRAKDLFENAMAAAAFAETGEHHTARSLLDNASAQIHGMLTDTDKKSLKFRVQIKPGETGREIIKHVQRHRDIVVAIYDDAKSCVRPHTPSEASAAATALNPVDRPIRQPKINASDLQKKLAVPLVVRRTGLDK